MIDRNHKLPVKRQCELLGMARSTAYYRPGVSQGNLEGTSINSFPVVANR